MAKQQQSQNVSAAAKEMQDFNRESTLLTATLQDLAKALETNAQAASKFTGDSAGAYSAMFRDSVNLAKELEGYTVDQLKNRKSEEQFLRKVGRLEQDRARVQSRIGYLQDKMATATKMEQGFISKSLTILRDTEDTLSAQVDHANNLKRTFEEISKKAKVFDDLSDFFKEIPGVSKAFGEFQKASDAARAVAAENGGWLKSYAAGAKQLSGALVKGVAAYGITTMVKGIGNADERIVSLSRNLNRSRQESIGLVKNFNEVARSTSGISGTDMQTAAEGFSEAMGTTAVVSASTAATLATQVKYMGISVDQANKLNAYSEATGTNIKDDTEQIAGQVIVSNARNKTSIKYQAIMKDIAGTSNAAKLLITGQGKSLTAAAIEAKKLGTTMEGIANIGKSMLDFESSIGNELEAELLTGGEINNERARALALMGDTEGLAKEVAKSGVLAKFEGSKNVLQQEALAKAYGMSKEEMANMVVESKALASLGAKDKSELSETVKKRLAKIDTIKDETERERQKAALIKQLGSDELVRQRENLTIAEQQAMANQKIVEAMDMLIPIIKPISEVFKFIADHAKAFAVALAVITGGSMLSKLSNLTGMFGKLSGGTGGAASVAEDLAGSTGGGGGKGFLGKMATKFTGGKGGAMLGKASKFLGKGVLGGAGIGALLSGISNVSEYGWTGEALGRTALSGVGTLLGGAAGTALLPGAGTIGGSMAGGMAGDALGDLIFGEKPETAEDFIMRPGQKPLKFRKDDIIMGGTSLAGNSGGGDSGEVVSLLRELIAATKQGKPVHLDGQKVNSVLGQNLYTVGG